MALRLYCRNIFDWRRQPVCGKKRLLIVSWRPLGGFTAFFDTDPFGFVL